MAYDTVARVRRDCPACAAGASTPIAGLERDGWRTVRCDHCAFVFLDEAPVYEALSETLAWSQQFQKEKKRRRQKQPLVSWLDQSTRWRLHLMRDDEWRYICAHLDAGRVLDVGCGPRNRIPEVFTPFGIEIEKAAAEAAQTEMAARGGRVIHAPALEGLEAFEADFFDGMIMRSYLEHELHPRDVLERAFTRLRPGGVLYVKVPNFATLNRVVRGADWCGMRFPDHLNYFTVSSLKDLAREVGFVFTLKNRLTRLTNDNMHAFLTRPGNRQAA